MKTKTIVRADGKILNIGGCKCSGQRPDIPVYSSNRYKASQLPKKVDLRPYMTAIEDQGQINSCTANATVGAFEYLIKSKYNTEVDLSRLFVYYNARAAQGDTDEDEGSCICDAVDSLKKIGICPEANWPNQKKLVLKKPSKDCYKLATELLISGCKRVNVSLNDYKLALAEGNPIIFGMTLFNSFDRQRRKGFVPMPSPADTSRGSHGSHAMLCVGYSDVDQVFIVRNSWGTQWGDHGYCYIPYNYMANPKFNHGDSWIIDIPDNIEIENDGDDNNEEEWDNEDAWSNDDDSVLTDLNNEFANMDDEQWQAFNDAMGKYDLPYRLGALFATACVMDDELSEEEAATAIEHLQNILKIFNYKMDASRVFHRCIKLAAKDGFLEETVEILANYLSPGALGTIAKNMYEIAGADGLDEQEEEFIDALVGAWLDTDEELEYNEDYDDEDEEDYDEDYDDEEDDDYFLDDDEGWDWDDEDDDECDCCCECDCDECDDDDEDHDDDDEDYDDDDEDYDDDDEDYDDDDEDYDDDDEDYDDDDEDYDDDDEDYDDDDEDYDDDDEDYDDDDDEEDRW